MPAIRNISSDKFQLLVWKIEEDLNFFTKHVRFNKAEMEEYGNISYEARRLEWMAARFTQRQLLKDSLMKDEWGKPHPANETGYVSIAHCKGYAAAVYSKEHAVGIDIEPVHDKVQRIAKKFLTEKERSFLEQDQLTEYLIASWSIKEAVYKWYGKKELSFKENICMNAFQLSDKRATVDFSKDDTSLAKEVPFEKMDNIFLAYTV